MISKTTRRTRTTASTTRTRSTRKACSKCSNIPHSLWGIFFFSAGAYRVSCFIHVPILLRIAEVWVVGTYIKILFRLKSSRIPATARQKFGGISRYFEKFLTSLRSKPKPSAPKANCEIGSRTCPKTLFLLRQWIFDCDLLNVFPIRFVVHSIASS